MSSLPKGNNLVPCIRVAFLLISFAIVYGCSGQRKSLQSFADYPGFKDYYKEKCNGEETLPPRADGDRILLERFKPRFILPPGGNRPIDFYDEYLNFSSMRHYPDGKLISKKVDRPLLETWKMRENVYLDFDLDEFRKMRITEEGKRGDGRQILPPVYGRVYRERVSFPLDGGKSTYLDLTFLKYNLVFAISGLPLKLPFPYEAILRVLGLDPENWHELDNFIAVYVVLSEDEHPVAIILAQHNYHRSYLVGKDLTLTEDGRVTVDIALRSNEAYLSSASGGPVSHRVVWWPLYFKYLLSGKEAPIVRGLDITYGEMAGGIELRYRLETLSPCDPFYTSPIMLGEPRPFLGRYIGRDGPPGSDFYTIPPLLPPGNLLKFSYLHDGDERDIEVVEESVDLKTRKIDIERIMLYGGGRFYADLIDRGNQRFLQNH